MTDETNGTDDIPNGEGHGDTSVDAPDTSSGGSPEQPDSAPEKENPDGTPVENPSGG
jgi:hypothetical protein